jgi:hypothetical protein
VVKDGGAMSHRIIWPFLIIIVFCLSPALPQTLIPHDRAYNVSLIRVIANPKLFDSRRLRLAGYLEHNGVDRAIGLYVTQLDGQNAILSNSIDLNLEGSSVEKLIGKYVILEATYHAQSGSLSDYLNGHLDHVSDLKIWHGGDTPK